MLINNCTFLIKQKKKLGEVNEKGLDRKIFTSDNSNEAVNLKQ